MMMMMMTNTSILGARAPRRAPHRTRRRVAAVPRIGAGAPRRTRRNGVHPRRLGACARHRTRHRVRTLV